MNWQSTLEQPGFVREKLIPALIEAAALRRNRHATYLLSRILLDLCIENKACPLKTLYTPDLVLEETLGVERQSIMRDLRRLLPGPQVSVVRKVIKDLEVETRCRCIRHGGEDKECIIGAAYLWKALLSQDLLRPADIESLKEPLERVVDILKDPRSVQKGDWLPEEKDKQQLWARKRVQVVFTFLQEMRDHIEPKPRPKGPYTQEMYDNVQRKCGFNIRKVVPDFHDCLKNPAQIFGVAQVWSLPEKAVFDFFKCLFE